MKTPNTSKDSQAKQRRTEIKRDPTTGRPLCPECETVMGKKEKRWSGRHRKQLWLCSACGRTLTLPLDFLPEDNEPYSAPAASLTESIAVVPPGGNHHGRLCDGTVEGKPRPCSLSEDGYCSKRVYPMSCLRYDREEWEKLPTAEKGRGT